MKAIGRILLLSTIAFSIVSCKKESTEYIEGNVAPPDNTIETVTKENYVNKLYISVLGRQATDTEYNAGLAIINKDNLSESNRSELVDVVMGNDEYYHNEYETVREDVLNGIDTSDYELYKTIFKNAKMATVDPDEIYYYDHFIARINLLQKVFDDLNSETINFIEVHKRCVYNHFYDEINMGTENFVVSMYQNFLFRYPTTDELDKASTMVDGRESIVFYELGKSKENFMDIFFASDEYLEGQIRTAFLRFLFREPSVEELVGMAALYKADFDFKKMQKRILMLDEYVGI